MALTAPTTSRTRQLMTPTRWRFCSMSAQFPFFKQQQAQRQRGAEVTDDISERPADVAPGDFVLPFEGIGEPEKLPVGHHGVNHRSPPAAAQTGLSQPLFVVRAEASLFGQVQGPV